MFNPVKNGIHKVRFEGQVHHRLFQAAHLTIDFVEGDPWSDDRIVSGGFPDAPVGAVVVEPVRIRPPRIGLNVGFRFGILQRRIGKLVVVRGARLCGFEGNAPHRARSALHRPHLRSSLLATVRYIIHEGPDDLVHIQGLPDGKFIFNTEVPLQIGNHLGRMPKIYRRTIYRASFKRR